LFRKPTRRRKPQARLELACQDRFLDRGVYLSIYRVSRAFIEQNKWYRRHFFKDKVVRPFCPELAIVDVPLLSIIGDMRKLLVLAAIAAALIFNMTQPTTAQKKALSPDPSLPIPKLDFDKNGELKITASATSANSDFDFLEGNWKMHHRRLNKRLVNDDQWTEFDSSDVNQKILGGTANMDTLSTTEMPGLEGKLFEGVTFRLFDPKTRLWRLYWVPSNTGILDPPVVGSFENGVGHFFTRDTFNGKPIIMMFRWDARDKDHPVWSQAFSPDNGKTWEWNWFNVSERSAK
jgi:hypothetical protein